MSDLAQMARDLAPLILKSFAVTSTYSPAYYGLTTSGVTTYTANVGRYTRIGDVVVFSAYLNWTAVTGTGNAAVSLPFTAANVTNQFHTASLWYSSMNFSGSGIICTIAPNTNYAALWTPSSGGASSQLAIEAAGELIITGSYAV
jgi:hypothetical protein